MGVQRETGAVTECKHLGRYAVPIFRENECIAIVMECGRCHERLSFIYGEKALKEWEVNDV